jgi:hypothetical protein
LERRIPWLRVCAEGLVIVVSILLAFGLQAWWEGQTDRQTERTILMELHTALSADLELLDRRLDRLRQIESRVGSLLAHLESGVPYADSLDAYFGTVYGVTTTELNTAAYESLKSQGLGLLSDQALRSHIARVYEQTYRRVEWQGSLESDVVLGLLRPYFLVHFRDLRFSESATPLDYGALLSDVEFLNLVAYRLQTVRQSHIGTFEQAISDVRDLIEATEFALGR